MKTVIENDTYYDNNIILIRDDGPDLADNEFWALMVQDDSVFSKRDKSAFFDYDKRDLGLECTVIGIIYISKDMGKIKEKNTSKRGYIVKIRAKDKNKCYIVI